MSAADAVTYQLEDGSNVAKHRSPKMQLPSRWIAVTFGAFNYEPSTSEEAKTPDDRGSIQEYQQRVAENNLRQARASNSDVLRVMLKIIRIDRGR
jgi:hypothetical protein